MQDSKLNNNLMINIVNIVWGYNCQTDKVQVLLVQNSLGPNANRWGLPTTLLRANENAEEASLRLVKEKMGIDLSNFNTEQLATFSNIKRTITGREIALTYMTYLPYLPELTPGYGAKDVKWFEVDHNDQQYLLKNQQLVLETLNENINENEFYNNIQKFNSENNLVSDHALILRLAFKRIRNRLDYLPTILLILGDNFTLKQARKVYAVFLKEPVEKIDNSNFRKTHGHLFSEVGIEHGKSGRPAKLYKLA
ncbi:NUDIX hydrolase [Lactobacillus halodurans]|uniref:NUDIX hydrolase n=1 Tax=Companilactobacillus halodurans TaxID=2584183 RepID=A0A5P0ZQ80_9LACO|nr:NUDIX domain-containing protein [Companilactobacillus halodurans]MQS76352.1 NUDIX hydrolase [Companilactobacillus halodurans]